MNLILTQYVEYFLLAHKSPPVTYLILIPEP